MNNIKTKRRGKRSIVCSDCGKLKNHTHYNWQKKRTTESTNKESNWLLNSRRCKECTGSQQSVLIGLKKENPYPKSNKCNCCGKISEYKLHLDHSHDKSGKFRGWLCRNCNTGIGMLGDNIVGIKRALKYLQNAA